jgi:hypothetical protein
MNRVKKGYASGDELEEPPSDTVGRDFPSSAADAWAGLSTWSICNDDIEAAEEFYQFH